MSAAFTGSVTILVNRGYVPRQKIRPETRMKGQVIFVLLFNKMSSMRRSTLYFFCLEKR